MIEIAIVGPESSGKTTLCEELSERYDGSIVREFARSYLADLERDYSKEDLILIAEGQLKLAEDARKKEVGIIFHDTEMLTIKIWHEYKYGIKNKLIDQYLQHQSINLYLLCSPDLPWEADVLRESPNETERKEIFKIYFNQLKSLNFKFGVVEGRGDDRILNSISLINQVV